MIPDILNSIIIKCNARSTVHSAHRCVLTRFFEKIFLAGDLKFEIPEDSYSPKKQERSDRILGLDLKSKLIYATDSQYKFKEKSIYTTSQKSWNVCHSFD